VGKNAVRCTCPQPVRLASPGASNCYAFSLSDLRARSHGLRIGDCCCVGCCRKVRVLCVHLCQLCNGNNLFGCQLPFALVPSSQKPHRLKRYITNSKAVSLEVRDAVLVSHCCLKSEHPKSQTLKKRELLPTEHSSRHDHLLWCIQIKITSY
jgi:hypothetical protein